MRINVTHRNGLVSDTLKDRIDKKLGKLDRLFEDDVEAVVRLSQEKGARNIVEITLNLDGTLIRAEEITNDMYSSVDKAIDKLVRQLGRHRKHLGKGIRGGEEAFAQQIAPADPEPEAFGRLVRVKRFEVKPMSVEDAISQMDMLGHSFFLFKNADTDTTCVVYRRLDGDIGMLEPLNG